jgi:acetyl-CoA carboxylase biotin carboxyl carrier protein
LDLARLKDLMEFMNSNDLCELEIEEEGSRVKFKKAYGDQPVMVSRPAAAPSVEAQPEEKADSGTIEIKSPMVGTFYRSPAPGAKSFTDVGSEITSGDVVCIIEAMKLMNEIKSEIGGKVVSILVENGEPVEFGQPLFLVKPL